MPCCEGQMMNCCWAKQCEVPWMSSLESKWMFPKIRGTPKWMVYNGKPLLKWMIWGYHYFWKHPNGENSPCESRNTLGQGFRWWNPMMRMGLEPSILFDREGVGFLGEVYIFDFWNFFVIMMVETWKTENKNWWCELGWISKDDLRRHDSVDMMTAFKLRPFYYIENECSIHCVLRSLRGKIIHHNPSIHPMKTSDLPNRWGPWRRFRTGFGNLSATKVYGATGGFGSISLGSLDRLKEDA